MSNVPIIPRQGKKLGRHKDELEGTVAAGGVGFGEDEGLQKALTGDRHFEQAGFTALLKEESFTQAVLRNYDCRFRRIFQALLVYREPQAILDDTHDQRQTEKARRPMNLHRRSLLASTAAGTGILLGTWRLPAAEKLKEFSFVIVSDTHLGRGDAFTPERQWRQAIAEINAAPGDFVLHLGDVVDSGREPQYPIYAATRKELKKPIHEVPGNHDPSPLFEKHIAAPIDRSLDHGGVRFILFGNSHTDSHLGFIAPEQIAWLDKQCSEAQAKDLQIAICCHVPIHTNTHPDRGWHVKPADGQTAFYEVADRYAERLLACFHGHFHNGIRGWRDRGQMVEVLCPSVCYNQSRQLEVHLKTGQASGFFVEELGAGYVLATLGGGKLTMRYKPLGKEQHGEYVAQWKQRD